MNEEAAAGPWRQAGLQLVWTRSRENRHLLPMPCGAVPAGSGCAAPDVGKAPWHLLECAGGGGRRPPQGDFCFARRMGGKRKKRTRILCPFTGRPRPRTRDAEAKTFSLRRIPLLGRQGPQGDTPFLVQVGKRRQRSQAQTAHLAGEGPRLIQTLRRPGWASPRCSGIGILCSNAPPSNADPSPSLAPHTHTREREGAKLSLLVSCPLGAQGQGLCVRVGASHCPIARRCGLDAVPGAWRREDADWGAHGRQPGGRARSVWRLLG